MVNSGNFVRRSTPMTCSLGTVEIPELDQSLFFFLVNLSNLLEVILVTNPATHLENETDCFRVTLNSIISWE